MAKRDYYETLGVAKGATEQDLKSAFRKLAKEHHPDKNPGDGEAEQKFKELNEAYEALKDPQKRAAYDRFGHAAFDGQGGRGGQGGAGFGPDFASSMSDIFDDLFGEFMGGRRGAGQQGGQGARARGGRERGADLRYNLEVSLQDAYTGKTAQLRVPSSVGCDVCAGTGAKPKEKPVLLEIGKAEVVADGSDVALIGLGSMFEVAEAAKKELEAKGLSVALINPRWIKPLDTAVIETFARKVKVICTFEDHVLHNGFGCAVMEHLNEARLNTPVVRIGWPDAFVEHGNVPALRKKHGLTTDAAVAKVLMALGRS